MVKCMANVDGKRTVSRRQIMRMILNFIFAPIILLFGLIPTLAIAQSHHVKIRVINAKTNQPITDERDRKSVV